METCHKLLTRRAFSRPTYGKAILQVLPRANLDIDWPRPIPSHYMATPTQPAFLWLYQTAKNDNFIFAVQQRSENRMKVATLPALSICVRLFVCLFCLSLDKLWALGHNYWQPAKVARNAALVADSSLEFSLACCKCVAIETAMMPVSPRRATTRHGMTFRRTPLPRPTALATGRTHSDRPKSVWRFRLQHFSSSRGTISRPPKFG